MGSDWAFMRLPSPGVCLNLVSTGEFWSRQVHGAKLKVYYWELKVDSWNFQWWRAQVRLQFSSMACEYTYVTHDFKNVSTPSCPLTTRRE